jgi:3-phenylpropionate/cinnamic acid dioxygenase small subunit
MSQETIGREALADVVRLLADYARLIDAGEAEPWSRLFTEDGIFVQGGVSGEVAGRADLVAFAEAAPVGVHVAGIPSFDRLEDGTLDVTSNFVFVGAENQQILAGVYRDRMVPTPGGLLFARREVVVRARVRRPASTHPGAAGPALDRDPVST